MEVSREDAIIDLTKVEGDTFLGKAEATPQMLRSDEPDMPYRTFRDKVEHIASEIAYETERTVEIYMKGLDDRIAYCDGDGLVIEVNSSN